MELMKTEVMRANSQGIEMEKNELRRLQLILWEQAQEAHEVEFWILNWFHIFFCIYMGLLHPRVAQGNYFFG